MTSERFVARLKGYFGPWRGDGRDGGREAEAVIRRWLESKRIRPATLDDLYLDLVETRKVEPVNTIGIADLASLLDRRRAVPTDAPRLISPDDEENVLPRDEAARRMRGIVETLTGRKA